MTREITLLVIAVWSMCCGGNGLRTQARAAILTREMLSSFQEHAKNKRLEEQREAVRRNPYREQARVAVEDVRERWGPVVDAYNALAAAHRLWVDWLLVFVERGETDHNKLRTLIREFVDAWKALAKAAVAFELTFPPVPPAVDRLMESPDDAD